MNNADNESKIYEDTIISLVKSYLVTNPNNIDHLEWYYIANCIGISYDKIQSLLDITNQPYINTEKLLCKSKVDNSINYEHHYHFELFECLLNYYYIRKSLELIKMDDTKISLKTNYELYQSISHNICMMNVKSGAYECLCNKAFSQLCSPQSFETFHPENLIDRLRPYVFYSKFYENNKKYLIILYEIINYQLLTHTNAMILIVIAQIMKHSYYTDNSTKKIAAELYSSIHTLFRNTRVILIQPNYLYLDTLKNSSLRVKKTDNTTRLHIVYGHDNYDTYSLRLDFSHQGINWIHYNNKTPGGVSSCFYSKQQYEDVILKRPNMKKCFIKQNNIYFLKEKINCGLTNDERHDFESIECKNSHSEVFLNNYCESDVLSFLSILSKFLINICNSTVDKTDTASRFAFNLDFLMCHLELFYISLFSSKDDNVKIQQNIIIDRAIKYGLINENESVEYESIIVLQMIIELAQERWKNLQ